MPYDDQSIKGRLYAIFAAMTALLLLIGVISFIVFAQTGSAAKGIIARNVPAALAATRLKSQIADLSAILPRLLAARETRELDIITAKIGENALQIQNTLADLRQFAPSPETDQLAPHLANINRELNSLTKSATLNIVETDLISKITAETRQYRLGIDTLLTPMIDDADFNVQLAASAIRELKTASKTKGRINYLQMETFPGQTFKDSLELQTALLELNAETNWISGTFNAIATSPDLEQIDSARINFDQIVHKVQRRLDVIGPDGNAAKLGDLTARMLELGQGDGGIFAVRRTFLLRRQDEQQLIDDIGKENATLAVLTQKIAGAASANSDDAMTSLSNHIGISQTIVISSIFVSLLLGFLAAFFMNRRVAIPIQQMGELMRRMANHDMAMNGMLDSLGQGLLFFGDDGLCSPIYSKACETLLECVPANHHIADVVKLVGPQRNLFKSTIAMLFKGQLPLGFSELAALAPSSYEHSKGLLISLSYRPITNAMGKLSSILLVATDLTEKKKADALLEENHAAAERVMRILHNRNHFVRFLQSFQSYFDALEPGASTLSFEQLRRDVHTFKGTADTFRLPELAHALHGFETDLVQDGANAASTLVRWRPILISIFHAQFASARQLLGKDFLSFGRVRTVPERHLLNFARQLRESGASDVLTESYFELLMTTPIREALTEFAVALQELADRFGKPLSPCAFTGDYFPILFPAYEALFASFIHIARNIIEHGIETAEVRRVAHKPPYATVTIHLENLRPQGYDGFVIQFRDDGSGIDIAALQSRLAEKGYKDLAIADAHTILQSLLDGGLSTAKQASMLSGRAIGLNAVKIETLKLGGTITLSTVQGEGTTLRLELPFIHILP